MVMYAYEFETKEKQKLTKIMSCTDILKFIRLIQAKAAKQQASKQKAMEEK